MSDAFWFSLPGLVSAVVAAYLALRIPKIERTIEQVHKATNSLTDRLVETTRVEAHAAGVKAEQERQK